MDDHAMTDQPASHTPATEKERDALQARIEELREKVSEQGAALALKARADFVVVSRAEQTALQARVEVLERALRDVINAAVGYSLGEIDGHGQLVATDTASVVLDGKGAKP